MATYIIQFINALPDYIRMANDNPDHWRQLIDLAITTGRTLYEDASFGK